MVSCSLISVLFLLEDHYFKRISLSSGFYSNRKVQFVSPAYSRVHSKILKVPLEAHTYDISPGLLAEGEKIWIGTLIITER